MKWLFKLIDKIVVWYRDKKHEYLREEQKPLVQEVISADKSLETKALATELRQSGALYHLACQRWLQNNEGKDIGDFDILPLTEKEIWMKQVQNA